MRSRFAPREAMNECGKGSHNLPPTPMNDIGVEQLKLIQWLIKNRLSLLLTFYCLLLNRVYLFSHLGIMRMAYAVVIIYEKMKRNVSLC